MNEQIVKKLDELGLTVGAFKDKAAEEKERTTLKNKMLALMAFIVKDLRVCDPDLTISFWKSTFGFSDTHIYKIAAKFEAATGVKPLAPARKGRKEDDMIAALLA